MEIILNKDSNLKNRETKTKYPYEIICRKPFQKICIGETTSESNSTDWWQAYNLVKHFREDFSEKMPNYRRANLMNVLDSLAGLYILCQSLYGQLEDNQIQLERSNLFVE